MIELKKICNLLTDTTEFVSSRRRELRLPPTDATDPPRLLTQEKDGCILFTWDDVEETSKSTIVTHIGLYEPSNQKHKVVWTYNQRVNIVSGTINKSRTLIAFTTYSREGSSPKKNGKEKYTAFLAEVQATSSRVFSLNLERSSFLKLQFIYSEKDSVKKESHMIVMLHKESLGLYHIPLGRVGDKGVVMRTQPETEQLAKKFVWCQWDSQNQRLYYIHYRRAGSGNTPGSSVNDHLEKDKIQPVLSCIQFYQDGKHDSILDVPLNFPFPYIGSKTRSPYIQIPVYHSIPDPFLNLSVLTQTNGTFCICYQHMETPYTHDRKTPVKRSRRSPALPSPSSLSLSLSESEEDVMEINYYICMVHHTKTLHCCVTGLPQSHRHRLHFSWHGDYLMVLLPGYFVHLLNVSIEFEPCHHILLHDRSVKLNSTISNDSRDKGSTESSGMDQLSIPQPTQQYIPVVSVLSPEAAKFSHLSNTCLHKVVKDTPSSISLFDYRTGDVLNSQINTESLIEIFGKCYMSTTRTALLHYVINRTRDFFLTKRLFEVLSNDIASTEVPGLISEFLIGTTYVSMRRQFDREILRLIPFTASETFRGQYEKNEEGERLARVSYKSLHSVNIGTRTAKDRRRSNVGDDMWDTIRRHLRLIQFESTSRFTPSTVGKTYKQMLLDIETGKCPGVNLFTRDQEDFLGSFHHRLRRSESPALGVGLETTRRVRPDTVLGLPPPFLQGNNIAESSDNIMKLTKEMLNKELSKTLSNQYKVKVSNVAKEYVSFQFQQSRQMCHLLWNLRGQLLPYTEMDFLPNLLDPSSDDEYELFQLFERYYMSCAEQAFPLPKGFESYFTALGFRCLNTSLFIQYIDRGIFNLTGEFMAQVIADLPDEESNVKLKQQLISRLSKNFAEECYRQWNHPICQRYFANKQVSGILSEFPACANVGSMYENFDEQLNRRRRADSTTSRRNMEHVSFPPLASFLRLLEKIDISSKSKHTESPPPRRSPVDIDFLEDVALFHTRKDTNYDLNTVNF